MKAYTSFKFAFIMCILLISLELVCSEISHSTSYLKAGFLVLTGTATVYFANGLFQNMKYHNDDQAINEDKAVKEKNDSERLNRSPSSSSFHIHSASSAHVPEHTVAKPKSNGSISPNDNGKNMSASRTRRSAVLSGVAAIAIVGLCCAK